MKIRSVESRAKLRNQVLRAVCVAGVLIACGSAWGDPLGVADGRIYRLDSTSTVQEGCFPPCMCPVTEAAALRGTFKLAYGGVDNVGIHTYFVQNVYLTVPIYGPVRRLVGSGVYRIGSPDPITVLQHRLVLELAADGGAVERYDSGWVPIGDLTRLQTTVSINNMYCWDRVLSIDASPAPATELLHYQLTADSTFQRGCFDPCDCPLEMPRPLVGEFDLLPIHEELFETQFALLNVRWGVLGPVVTDAIPISGFGVFRMGGDFVAIHQLSLELIVGDAPRAHYDSGVVPGGTPFPRIDEVVSLHGIECFDTVMHVVADPAAGEVCGGIAAIPCTNPGEFCKYRIGQCCCDFMGVCTPIPQACPDVWDPVCGCDGVTYGNACEADMAGVAIDHLGACAVACQPADNGFGCVTTPCSDIPEVSCIPTVLQVDMSTGAIFTLECGCLNFNTCHIEFGNASPFAVGYCPDGGTCTVVARDTDGDGLDDWFTAECLPTGACCSDVGGSPLPVPVCNITTVEQCGAANFQGPGTTCEPIEACCMMLSGSSYCLDTSALCCMAFNGQPLGPNSSCANLPDPSACVRYCGGWSGNTCNDGEFCKYPEGICSDAADHQGICTPIPTICPDVWLPVCGCDGVTYGNECEADAAGVSVLHQGECGRGACCIADPNGTVGCFVSPEAVCVNEGGQYQGDGTTCPTDPTIPCGTIIGACCLPDASCRETTSEICLAEHGSPLPGVPCSAVDCAPDPIGACCLVAATGDIHCAEVPRSVCLAEGGDYQGNGTVCSSDPTTSCPPPSACCLPDGACLELPPTVCLQEGGTPVDGASCDVVYCGPVATGACCFPTPGTNGFACRVTTADDCFATGGEYLGDNTECPADPSLPCVTPCDPPCASGQECFAGCGTISMGVEGCLVFTTDSGLVLVLADPAGFAVGDRVFITGCIDMNATTTCQQGVGVLFVQQVRPCEQTCGGIAGIPCDDPNDFCKFPEGTCEFADMMGVCTPIPGNGCPEIYAPVCGCDGVTYVNECESDAASMSLRHHGPCAVTDCAATRAFTTADTTGATYCPGTPVHVRIVITVPNTTSAIAVEDRPPGGWAVSNISDGGHFDATNHKVKWGPLFAPFPAELSYDVIPVANTTGTACFAGAISVDGINRTICGDACLAESCCPRMRPDLPQAACDVCRTGDCSVCGDQACGNGQITICELMGYACAWLSGCNDDMAGVTRAAYIWHNGECYCWDDTQQNFFPVGCDVAAGCCPSSPGGGGQTALAGSATLRELAVAKAPVRASSTRGIGLSVTVEAPANASAIALEIVVPDGMRVTDISDNGSWDGERRKIKWGPFTDNLSRTVTFSVAPTRTKGSNTHRSLRDATSGIGFTGTVSFDGINQPIGVE